MRIVSWHFLRYFSTTNKSGSSLFTKNARFLVLLTLQNTILGGWINFECIVTAHYYVTILHLVILFWTKKPSFYVT
ncbi:hypothetical protein PEDI_57020 [Persicobacter diffluens]|uniref:Uncharacterized protein n=1 Tax=Persicobacter diffluens TaxID=981 RepID=A0AAN4W6T2_9BACT|nr:hypothetical protein PEDI_52930 [Persicobacter diffluens]GJM65150.1 hypothetical protein PEDI_57020 [Persicobacter diffluens]